MRTGAGGRMQPHTQGRQGPQELDEAGRTLPGASEGVCVPAWISDTPATKLGGKRCLLPQPQPVAVSFGTHTIPATLTPAPGSLQIRGSCDHKGALRM